MRVRFVPKAWHNETWICSMRGHCAPATTAVTLLPEQARLGMDIGDDERAARCLRCDAWLVIPRPKPGEAEHDVLPPFDTIDKPRRGKVLQDAILLRLIAINRALHSIAFTILAVVLVVIDVRLPGLKGSAESLNEDIANLIKDTGQNPSRDFLARQLHKILDINGHTILILVITAVVYAVIEGVEAVGLWKERRWAEYLTVVATAGFLPFEVHELIDRVTALRVGGLIVNIAVLVYLVWSKHLFGMNGGITTLEEAIDWDDVLANPSPATVAALAFLPAGTTVDFPDADVTTAKT